jgi:phage terminase large subunit
MDLEGRLKLLKKAEEDLRFQTILMEKCKRDLVFWFNTFCWTVDPRKPEGLMPFLLYPVQEWAFSEVQGCIKTQCDWGIEKSRDMGASWGVMLVFQHGFLFETGYDFHVGSYTADEVDKSDRDPSTLMGKFRLNLNRLPPWMRPKIRDKYMSISNLENGNFLTGQSASANFGRGKRKRSILLDEMAFWQYAETAWGNCSQTTKSRGTVSTPWGNNNKYAHLMLDKENDVMEFPGLKDEMLRKGILKI